MGADLVDAAQPAAPRRRDIIGVIPQDVVRERRDDVAGRELGDRHAPCATRRNWCSVRGNWPLRGLTKLNCHGCLTVPHQLGGYLPDAARFMITRATASWPSSDFAAGFVIDRDRDAIGLLVELRSVVGISVDQGIKRPAGRCAATRLRSRSTAWRAPAAGCR